MMQRWFYARRNTTEMIKTQLTKWASECVGKTLDVTQYITVKPIDNFIYQVKDGHKDHVVKMNERTCTYRRFDLDFLSCAHVYAVIRYLY